MGGKNHGRTMSRPRRPPAPLEDAALQKGQSRPVSKWSYQIVFPLKRFPFSVTTSVLGGALR